MNKKLREMEEKISKCDDAELVKMLEENSANYDRDTLMIVEYEADKRGGLWKLKEKLIKIEDESQQNHEAFRSVDAGNSESRSGSTEIGILKGGSKIIKEELILNEWGTVVEHGAGHAQEVILDIHKRLLEAKIPGGCEWFYGLVKSSGLFAKVKRNFLLVNLREFHDYHIYIGIRDYGNYLDCCRFLTVEPGRLKRWLSSKITGYSDALSVPKNILVHQDMRAWVTIVHHIVIDALEELMTVLGKDPRLIQRGSKGFLEIW
ncbi:hypothetical protein TRIP_C10073 [Candidatus Zixiibacteriota bacterium]|nr:hypothetical protein TRIP_C10073 [candidate division Zixibacteria bacterium]